jgi:glycosyltransferase involved in cell wall biosynthesis
VYRGLTVAAVVPAWREERLIAKVITTMPDLVDHIVVVDDCSPDGTSDKARATGDPRLTLIRHEVNKGVGGSIVTGHKKAMELGADVMVVMAGDAQMDPDYLPVLLDPIVDDGYGFTKANRFYSATSFDGMPRLRVFGNITLTFMTKAASGYWNLVDPQNGYTAVTRAALERIPLDRVAERYDFENDLLVWLNIADVRAKDVPIPAVYGDEISTLNVGTIVPRVTWTLFKGFWRRMWRKYILWSFSPVALLLLWGMFLLALSAVPGIFAIWSALHGDSPTSGTVLLAVTPFLCGFWMVIQALVLDIMATPK